MASRGPCGLESRSGRAHRSAETHARLRGHADTCGLLGSGGIEQLFSVPRPQGMMSIAVFRSNRDGGRGRERPHVNAALGRRRIQLIRDPADTRSSAHPRKHAAVKKRTRGFREHRGFLVTRGTRPYRGRAVLLLGERKHLAVWRPEIGDVRDALVRFGKPLRDSVDVGALPQDAEVAFAIRLERDPFVFRRPDWARFAPVPAIVSRRGAEVPNNS
jgi:hypothetical protein